MRTTLVIIAIAVAAAGVYWYVSRSQPNQNSDASSITIAPELVTEYRNSAYGFSLKMPEGYSAQEIPDPSTGTVTLVLQNKSGDGIQIVITSFDEDTGAGYTLTKERILQDVSDLAIADEQPVEVGTDYKGLAFKSNNEVFGGSSREVWFVFRGNLYQISTYARLDFLLKAIFSTWQFN